MMKSLLWFTLAMVLLLNFTSLSSQQQQQPSGPEQSNSVDSASSEVRTTAKPVIDFDDDDEGEDDDDEEDAGANDKVSSTLMASTGSVTTSKPTTSEATMKVCVDLSPTYASTRNGPFVTFECLARLCSDDENDNFPADMYQFRSPVFDWNSQFTHLLVANGSCDVSRRNCWHKIDVNVDALSEAMEMDGVEQIEIRCTVADYVRSFSAMNYVFGEDNSVLRYFAGARAHEPCNATDECGESMVCQQLNSEAIEDDQSLALGDDSSSAAMGVCECPTEQLVAPNTPGGVATLRSFLLLPDPVFQEQVCLPVLTLNETCQLELQCSARDSALHCRPRPPPVAETNGGLASSETVCLCDDGFTWDAAFVPRGRCVTVAPGDDDNDKDDDEDQDGAQDRSDATANATPQQDSDELDTDDSDPVHVWWLFPPGLLDDAEQSNSMTTQSDSLPPPNRRSCHALLYYGARVFTLTTLAWVVMVTAVAVPLLVALLTLFFYCRRRMVQRRQYQARRASLSSSDTSIFYPDYVLPGSPSEKSKTVTFGFAPEAIVATDTESTRKHGKSRGKTNDDKLDLVENDHLEQMHRFA